MRARAIASICCSPPESVPAVLQAALAQPWEEREDALLVGRDRLAVGAREGAHGEVLGDRELCENAAALRHQCEPRRAISCTLRPTISTPS
jgi:hypothetical protein